jgi:hypothetical protein
MIPGGKMNLYKKLLWLIVLNTVFFIIGNTSGFTGTTATPPQTSPPGIKKATPTTPPPTSPQEIKKVTPLPVVDPLATHKKTCGQCHLSYPPEFLPSGSWEKLLASTEKHFEETLKIDQKTKAIIESYLKKNSAENSKSKIAQKIMQSLEGDTPLRITEVPYILKKHRKIKPEDFQRKPIGSFSNCGACHLLADKGIFNRKIAVPE